MDFDKIGSGNYYWSFPSKVLQRRKRDLADLESELEGGEAKKNRLMDSVQKARVGRDESVRWRARPPARAASGGQEWGGRAGGRAGAWGPTKPGGMTSMILLLQWTAREVAKGVSIA